MKISFQVNIWSPENGDTKLGIFLFFEINHWMSDQSIKLEQFTKLSISWGLVYQYGTTFRCGSFRVNQTRISSWSLWFVSTISLWVVLDYLMTDLYSQVFPTTHFISNTSYISCTRFVSSTNYCNDYKDTN